MKEIIFVTLDKTMRNEASLKCVANTCCCERMKDFIKKNEKAIIKLITTPHSYLKINIAGNIENIEHCQFCGEEIVITKVSITDYLMQLDEQEFRLLLLQNDFIAQKIIDNI